MSESLISAVEQALIDEVSSDYLMEATRTIAQWERLSGTPQEAESFDWIERELDRFGLDVNRYHHPALVSWPEDATLTLHSGDGTPWRPDSATHAFGASTDDVGLSGEIVFVGAPTAENLRQVDVAGKIVLIDGIITPHSNRIVESFDVAGSVWIAGSRFHERGLSPIWGTPTPETASLLPITPSVSILAEDGETLKTMVEAGPVRAELQTKVHQAWAQIPLITADLNPATAGDDRFVLFSGHVDSWYYGAMDNGTANATMLEVARILSGHRGLLRRGVRLAFWSGHSHARYAGSAWYADNFWRDLHDNCVAHVNVDSVGGRGATILSEGNSMAELREFTGDAIEAVAGQRLSARRFGRSGDQSFWGHGIPSTLMSLSEQTADAVDPALAALHHTISGGASLAGGLGWWWHTPEDLPDKIDPDLLVRDASIYVLILSRLCSLPVLPLDYRPTVGDMTNRVASLQEAAGDHFSLDPLPELLKELAAKLDAFYDDIDTLADEGESDVVNTSLMALGRALIPVDYTATGLFDHDLAVPTSPLPGLAAAAELPGLDPESGDYHYLVTRLVRERNRVEDGARRALAALQ